MIKKLGVFLKKHKREALGVLVLGLILAALFVIGFFVQKPLLQLIAETDRFRSWAQERGALGKLAFTGMVTLQVILAFIPGEPFELAAGYMFGAWWGTALCLLGAFAGGIIVFLLVKKFGVRLVRVFFSKKQIDRLHFLKKDPRRVLLFLIIFMIPGTPKDLLCYFAGLTDLSFPAWLLISSLGRIPSIITSTVGGAAVGEKNYAFAVIVFAVTIAISAAGLLIYQRILKKKNQDNE